MLHKHRLLVRKVTYKINNLCLKTDLIHSQSGASLALKVQPTNKVAGHKHFLHRNFRGFNTDSIPVRLSPEQISLSHAPNSNVVAKDGVDIWCWCLMAYHWVTIDIRVILDFLNSLYDIHTRKISSYVSQKQSSPLSNVWLKTFFPFFLMIFNMRNSITLKIQAFSVLSYGAKNNFI